MILVQGRTDDLGVPGCNVNKLSLDKYISCLLIRCGDEIVAVNGVPAIGMSNSELIPMLKEQRNKVTLTVVSWPGSLVWKLKPCSSFKDHLWYQIFVDHHAKLNVTQGGNAELLLYCVLSGETSLHYWRKHFFTVLRLPPTLSVRFKVTVNQNSCSFLDLLEPLSAGAAERDIFLVFLYKVAIFTLRHFLQF